MFSRSQRLQNLVQLPADTLDHRLRHDRAGETVQIKYEQGDADQRDASAPETLADGTGPPSSCEPLAASARRQ